MNLWPDDVLERIAAQLHTDLVLGDEPPEWEGEAESTKELFRQAARGVLPIIETELGVQWGVRVSPTSPRVMDCASRKIAELHSRNVRGWYPLAQVVCRVQAGAWVRRDENGESNE